MITKSIASIAITLTLVFFCVSIIGSLLGMAWFFSGGGFIPGLFLVAALFYQYIQSKDMSRGSRFLGWIISVGGLLIVVLRPIDRRVPTWTVWLLVTATWVMLVYLGRVRNS